MTEEINVKLVRTNVITRWYCHACGGETEKDVVLAEAYDDNNHLVLCVCGRCLKSGDVDKQMAEHATRLQEEAQRLQEEAQRLRSLIGHVTVPTYAEWKAENVKANCEMLAAAGYSDIKYLAAVRAEQKRLDQIPEGSAEGKLAEFDEFKDLPF